MIDDRQVNDYSGRLNSCNLSSACRNLLCRYKDNSRKSSVIVFIVLIDLLCRSLAILTNFYMLLRYINQYFVEPSLSFSLNQKNQF